MREEAVDIRSNKTAGLPCTTQSNNSRQRFPKFALGRFVEPPPVIEFLLTTLPTKADDDIGRNNGKQIFSILIAERYQ